MGNNIFLTRIGKRMNYDLLLLSKLFYHRACNLFSSNGSTQTVFVAGVQRSGTNMMMDVLELSFETDVYHERDPRAFDNYQMRGIEVIRNLYNKSKARFFIIKTLCELQKLPVLMGEFSSSKTVWINRNYEDVVNSMLVSFRNQARQVNRIVKDRASDGWLSEGMSDMTRSIICERAHPDLDDASAAALIWYFRSILFFEQGFDKNPDVILVQYEELVSDPLAQFKRIFDFIGLKYIARVSNMVTSGSIRRRGAPGIESEIKMMCEGLMQKFDKVIQSQKRAAIH
jgi:hypothetical protein